MVFGTMSYISPNYFGKIIPLKKPNVSSSPARHIAWMICRPHTQTLLWSQSPNLPMFPISSPFLSRLRSASKYSAETMSRPCSIASYSIINRPCIHQNRSSKQFDRSLLNPCVLFLLLRRKSRFWMVYNQTTSMNGSLTLGCSATMNSCLNKILKASPTVVTENGKQRCYFETRFSGILVHKRWWEGFGRKV